MKNISNIIYADRIWNLIVNQPIGLVGSIFASDLGEWGWVIPKTQKIVLDTSLLNTQHYKSIHQG